MSEQRAGFSGCHRGIDAGVYVLHALSAEESRDYTEHLTQCRHCRAEVGDLRLVADTLPIAAPQTSPPPALRSRIMAVVNAESELLLAAGPAADRPAPKAPRRRRLSAVFSNPLRPALAGALACALLGLGVVGGVVVQGTGAVETKTLAAWAKGAAKAQLTQTGENASLQLTDMPSPPKGQVYQVWFDRGDGQLLPTHTLFNVRSDGRAKVAIEESVAGVERILVTAEPTGGSLAPSADPVITATPA
jgi:anti-sigma-K factor RskA